MINRKRIVLGLMALALAACSGRPAATPIPPTATLAPATEVVATPTPVEITVVVPVTVVVPQVVVVTATPEPATPVPPTAVPTAMPTTATTVAAPPTQATTNAQPAQTQPAGAFQAEVPAIASTPQALNGPDPMAGVVSQLFAEYFSPPDYWGVGDNENSSTAITDRHLTMVNKQLHSFAWTFNGIKGKDFYTQVFLTTPLCGFGDNYGLAFRAKDDANLDLFGISCEGRYRLLEYSQGKSNTIVDWTDSKYIRKFETTNVLGVRAVGDQISLYVNNYFLTTVTAGANQEGRFGLYVGNAKTPDLTVVFQALTASRITP